MKQKKKLSTQFKKLGELETKSPRNMAITSSSMARNPNPTEKAVRLVVLPSSSVPPLLDLGSQQDRVWCISEIEFLLSSLKWKT